ncbi:MAG: alkaline phosphatase family protein [Pseudonocardiaceae bacterium]|nr:alkaline phosphatase family protein [Pseudonocardiaceae bacterium]
MAELVLGPMVRHVDENSAAVWVETDVPCTVEVRDVTSPTFTVHGHHYALLELCDLPPASSLPYTVRLDGELVWPQPASDLPASRIRTVDPQAPLRLVFGSCRTSVGHDHRTTLTHGVDVLRSFAYELASRHERDWPTTLLLLGDQVYADEPPETMRQFIRGRRDTNEAPGEELADFEEFAELYRLAWIDPEVRWLLSTVPTAMIMDDHDLRDDWNTSQAWREQMARLPWWRERVSAGLGSYWIYQHLGNLPPKERAADRLLAALRAADGDGGAQLDEFALRADEYPEAARWSYVRDFGPTRLVMLDTRCSRVLVPGRRSMLDPAESEWFAGVAAGGHEHLVIGSSLPYMLPSGLHYLENWNEAVCDGAWGDRAARAAEQIRQGVDLEHWGAFRRSFEAMAQLVLELAGGQRGRAPASIGFLSGDVHYSYLARAALDAAPTTVYQAVCSPIRNPLSRLARLANGAASFGLAGLVGRRLARWTRISRAPFNWKVTAGPWFHNTLATLEIDGSRVTVRWNAATMSRDDPPPMQQLGEHQLD